MNLHCLNINVVKIGFRDSPSWNANVPWEDGEHIIPPKQLYLLILLDAMLNEQT